MVRGVKPTPFDVCGWYISPTQPTCGKPPVAKVRVRGKGTDVMVPLCAQHKQQHDVTFADARTEREEKRRGGRG
jgi:hypothetical protein